MSEFEKILAALINIHSLENESNTPDFILAQYLLACLATFTVATQQREAWYGRDATPSLPGATLAKDQREVERLRAVEKAAEIFSKLNIEHLRDWPDDRELWDCGGTMLRVGHVRKLRDALAAGERGEG